MLTPNDQPDVAGNAAPLTRRQLREAEQAGRRSRSRRTQAAGSHGRRASARSSARSSAAPSTGTGRPATRSNANRAAEKAAAVKAPANRTAASKSRSIASKGFSVVAMGFVATVTVATSLPANALFTSSDMAALPVQASAASAERDSLPGQSLTVDDVQLDAVTRETYTVESYQEVALAQSNVGIGTFSNNPNGTIQWPFIVGVPMSGDFGPRIAPCRGCSSDHKGVDFAPGSGAPIQSIADGVVRYVESSDYGFGVHAIVDHIIDGELVTSVYAHMRFGSLAVEQGQVIKVGDQIGAVGNTGASTGPHLHLEIHVGGSPVDPYAWLKAHAN